ncbi:MAG TPA: PAS domain-containing protein [Micropepsaceae bacterium]|jgi:hypothetical protein
MITQGLMIPDSYARLASIAKCRTELQALFRFWEKLRGPRSMPARRDFDPADLRALLPHLILIDVFAQKPPERRFRVRLQGTAQVDYQGSDWTGCYLHEKTEQASADRLCAVGDHIVATHEPWMSTGGLYWTRRKPYSRFESILLPLSDDDATVNMILGLTIFSA